MQGSTVDLAAGSVLNPVYGLTTLATTNNVTSNIQGAGSFVLQGRTSSTWPTTRRSTSTFASARPSPIPNRARGPWPRTVLGTLAISGTNTYTGRTFAQAGILLDRERRGLRAGRRSAHLRRREHGLRRRRPVVQQQLPLRRGRRPQRHGRDLGRHPAQTTFSGTMSLGDDIQIGAADSAGALAPRRDRRLG